MKNFICVQALMCSQVYKCMFVVTTLPAHQQNIKYIANSHINMLNLNTPIIHIHDVVGAEVLK